MSSFSVKCRAYLRLTRMDKPIGTLLLLWPTLWALWIAADGRPQWPIVMIFIAGVVVMRSAGCVINDFADRHVDGQVKRTCQRPIVSGEVSAKEALVVFAVLILIALGLVLLLNWATFKLAFYALGLAVVYPFCKRFTQLPQVVLGAAFSFAIPMAFMATNGQLDAVAWWLFSANLLWTVAYDTQYAMVDRDDDLRIGVKSTAILFGQRDNQAIILLQALTLLLLIRIGLGLGFTWPFYLGLLFAAGLFGYQYHLTVERQRQRCFAAFLNNHYVGMVIMAGVLGHYLLR